MEYFPSLFSLYLKVVQELHCTGTGRNRHCAGTGGRVHELYPVIRLAVHADNRAIRLPHRATDKQTERGAAECQQRSRRGLP